MDKYKVILISENKLKDFGLLDENLSYKYIAPILQWVQNWRMRKLFGQPMYDDLRQKVVDNTLSDLEKGLINTFIHPILHWWVCSELPIPLSNKFRNMGLVQNSGDNSLPTSLQDIQYIKHDYVRRATEDEKIMTEFICENNSSFPLYRPELDNFCNIVL